MSTRLSTPRYEKWLCEEAQREARHLRDLPRTPELDARRDALGLRFIPYFLEWDEIDCYLPELAALVLEILRDLDSRAVANRLAAHCKSAYPDTRFAAAHTLARLGDPRGTAALLDLSQDKDEEFDTYRHAAVEALGELGNPTPEVLHALIGFCLDRDEEINVRSCATKALGKLGDTRPEVITTLLSLLDDHDEALNAVAALATLGDAQGISALEARCAETQKLVALWQDRVPTEEFSYSDDDRRRYLPLFIAETLGEQGNAQGLAALTALCNDTGVQPNIRLHVASILANNGEPLGTTTLVQFCTHTDENFRLEAATALASGGDERGISALVALCATVKVP